MIRRFCDSCEQEITESNGRKQGNGGRVRRAKNGIVVEVMVAQMRDGDQVWNSGDFCKDCVIDAVANGGDL